MRTFSRLVIRNIALGTGALILIWMPVMQTADQTGGTRGIPLVEASILASAGIVMLFGIHIILEARKERKRSSMQQKKETP